MNNTWEIISVIVGSVATSGLGLGAIIFGLSTWLGKVWSKRIEDAQAVANQLRTIEAKSIVDKETREDQAKLDERMKVLEHKYDQLKTSNEHFHQISQQTYQKLFEEKIEAYNKLYSLYRTLRDLKTNINFEFLDMTSIKFQTTVELIKLFGLAYDEFQKEISQNLIKLSKPLIEKYLEWQEIFDMAFDMHVKDQQEKMYQELQEIHDNVNNHNQDEIEEMFEKIKKKYLDEESRNLSLGLVVGEHFPELVNVFNQLQIDIKDINKKIDSSMIS